MEAAQSLWRRLDFYAYRAPLVYLDVSISGRRPRLNLLRRRHLRELGAKWLPAWETPAPAAQISPLGHAVHIVSATYWQAPPRFRATGFLIDPASVFTTERHNASNGHLLGPFVKAKPLRSLIRGVQRLAICTFHMSDRVPICV